MKYIEWRDEFEHFLGALERDERERILAYYGEMYADKRDSGLTEEQAVAEFGAPYDATKKILDEEGAKKGGADEGTQAAGDDERAQFTSSGAVDALEINGALGNIYVRFYDGKDVCVDYPTTAILDYKVTQQGGKVAIRHRDVKFKNVNLKNGIIPDMTIDVPKDLTPDCTISLTGGTLKLDGGDYGNIDACVEGGSLKTGRIYCSDAKIVTDAGAIDIDGAVFHRMHAEINAGKMTAGSLCGSTADIKVNAGAAQADSVDCRRAEICVSAGKADITLCGAKEDYDAQVKRTLGSCNLDGRSLNCERSVKAEVYFGSLNINFTK